MPQIKLRDGTISYRDAGSGPPVVFVHGLLVDGRLWDELTPLLTGELRCVVPDLPLGSHRIPLRREAERGPHAVARLVGELLAALELNDVTLVANDTGGAIAQLVALDHGERLGRLVLTNCDCFEVFPPKEFAPMMQAARVPAAMYAALQPLRAAPAAGLRRARARDPRRAHRRLGRRVPDRRRRAP
jgi:pimeloyl-ACP methyl ester carboxylesterase